MSDRVVQIVPDRCYLHAWRQILVRLIDRGVYRGLWKWRYRCKKCGHLLVFRTPYPPSDKTEKSAYQPSIQLVRHIGA